MLQSAKLSNLNPCNYVGLHENLVYLILTDSTEEGKNEYKLSGKKLSKEMLKQFEIFRRLEYFTNLFTFSLKS